MITSLHFKLGTTWLYFFFFLYNIRVFQGESSVNCCLSVCLFVFQVFFSHKWKFSNIGDKQKHISKKIFAREEENIRRSQYEYVFFRTNENCAILGIKTYLQKLSAHEKYTSFTVLVKCRRGGWKITKQEKIEHSSYWAQLGINPLIHLKKCSLLHIIRDSPSTFYKETIFDSTKDTPLKFIRNKRLVAEMILILFKKLEHESPKW